MVKSHFAAPTGGSKPFKMVSISFEDQATALANTKIQLKIERSEANAAAMQGILKFNKCDFSWNFEDGLTFSLRVSQALTEWRDRIESQLLTYRRPTKNWDRVDAALELLLIGGSMFGCIRSDKTLVETIEPIFLDWNSDTKFLSDKLKNLSSKIMSKRSLLLEEFLSFSVSSKGGSTGHMLNPGQFFHNAKKFTSNSWIMRQTEPDETTDIGKLYKVVKSAIDEAIKEEWQLRQSWFKNLEENFGHKPKIEIVSIVENFINSLTTSGVGIGQSKNTLEEALTTFKTQEFDDPVSALKELVDAEPNIRMLMHLGSTQGTYFGATSKLIDALETTYNAAENALTSQTQYKDRNKGQLVELKLKIENDLNDLQEIVNAEKNNA